jgi:hypothetical protein
MSNLTSRLAVRNLVITAIVILLIVWCFDQYRRFGFKNYFDTEPHRDQNAKLVAKNKLIQSYNRCKSVEKEYWRVYDVNPNDQVTRQTLKLVSFCWDEHEDMYKTAKYFYPDILE